MTSRLIRNVGLFVIAISFAAGIATSGLSLFAAGLWTTTIAFSALLSLVLWRDFFAGVLGSTGIALVGSTVLFSILPSNIHGAVLLCTVTWCASLIALALKEPMHQHAFLSRFMLSAIASGTAHLALMHALAMALHGPGSSMFAVEVHLTLLVPLAWSAAAFAIYTIRTRSN